ncbi:DNA repair protein [Sediminimonas sp.]|uniref:DNA repair protein n=1 Tax=Sediminimonas sp. TaxID=2823379 RepID=UPI0025F405B9|nr:DNA repair protein [Sediminimonas sp.]
MTKEIHAAFFVFQRIVHVLGIWTICLSAVAALALTALSAAGVLPWLSLPISFGNAALPQAGMGIQIAVTALLLILCGILPGSARVMALENSHRSFHMSMNDVLRSYHAAHAADRSGHFLLSAQFDEVRDRLAFLRQHPELGELEPDVLELAAQMSQVSRDLAQTYSDDNVNRARTFLRERQAACARFDDRLEQAKIITQELGDWRRAVEMDEAVARAQVNRLVDDLREALPEVLQEPPQPTAAPNLPPHPEPPKPVEPLHGAFPRTSHLHSQAFHGPAK